MTRDELKTQIGALIDRLAGGGRDDAARDRLLDEAAAYQRERVHPYARLCSARGDRAALPTDVFRFARVASFEPAEEIAAFLTSGTTSGARGRHAFSDLSLYDRAARTAAAHALFPDAPIDLVVLAPHPHEAPESSLSYMLGRFEEWFGARTTWVWRDGGLDLDVLSSALDTDRKVALLGTSFAFVHAEDRLDRSFQLPAGSRIMQTGGFKGRSREIAKDELARALSARYGVTEIVAEYGMTELSSQMYGADLLWAPGWVRATAVDPETLAPVPDGTAGVLRIDDLANLDSVCAIQTSDLAIIRPLGIELLGRAPGAIPRGCSLAIDEALGDELT
jgi:hypothetical protein